MLRPADTSAVRCGVGGDFEHREVTHYLVRDVMTAKQAQRAIRYSLPIALLVIGGVLGVAGLLGPSRGLRETLITLGGAAAATAPFWAFGVLSRERGRRRDLSLQLRYPSALVVPAARTDEARIAFERLPHMSSNSRNLPSTFTVVVDSGELSLWAGTASKPTPLVTLREIAEVTYEDVRVNAIVRASLRVSWVAESSGAFLVSPIGSGWLGYGPLDSKTVHAMVDEFRARLIPRRPPDASAVEIRSNN